MIQYPISFDMKTRTRPGIGTHWDCGTDKHESRLTLAIPTEFSGPGDGFSPEDLYASALQNCFVATFKVFAEKSDLTYESLQGDARLTVDRDENGKPWMSDIALHFRLEGASQPDLARHLLERVTGECMILNSVKTRKTFTFDVV